MGRISRIISADSHVQMSLPEMSTWNVSPAEWTIIDCPAWRTIDGAQCVHSWMVQKAFQAASISPSPR